MKQKVVMVAACPFPANHGSPASIREMSESLVELGHEVHILTYPIKEDIPVIGPIIHRVSFPFMNRKKVKVGPSLEKFVYDPLMVFRLIWLIWTKKIDVIHAHNYEGALIGWLAKIVTRRPMLYNAVNNMVDELGTYDFVWSKSFAAKLAKVLDNTIPFMGDYITAVSDSLKKYLISLGVSGEKIQVLPAGVNSTMFSGRDKATVRQKYGFTSDDKIVIYTGSMDVFQQIEYLVEAVSLLMDKIPRIQLILAANIANDKDIDRINGEIDKFGMQEHARIIQNVSLDQLPDYLELADIAALPRTDCPGHPVKILNYMAAQKAIVGFEGASKGLHHMKNAFLAEDHNVEQFAEGIELLFEKPDIADHIARAARTSLESYYEWKVLSQGIEVIYDMICTGDYDSKRDQLKKYISDSYHPKFRNRRSSNPADESDINCQRKSDRRIKSEKIRFIERREVIDAE